MTDTSNPLTSQALARLRRLAQGNGFAPEKIEIVETQEKVYAIEGVTRLTPFCEHQTARYPGPVRGKDRTSWPDIATLQAEVLRRRQDFIDKHDWAPAAIEELKTAPSEGWGLDGAKIALRDRSVILAASGICGACQGRKLFTCPQCEGNGFVVCAQCEGRGFELCYNCSGRGENPAHPGQPCVICHGKRYAPCRFCTSTGKLVCPTCQGRRGTPCPECQGAGIITEEIALACGATVNFSLTSGEWPSGLRRGLDRLGIVNLIKGHADVKRIGEPPPKKTGKEGEDKAPDPAIVRYVAQLPYADIKLRLGGTRAILISVFGKRGVMMGMPPFLDEALEPARTRLKNAAAGNGSLADAIKARALRDALTLEIGGQGKVENFRRLYPVGLSPRAMQEILLDMRQALIRHTRHARRGAAALGGAVGALLLAGFILMPLHGQLTQKPPWIKGFLIDLIALLVVTGLGWAGLGKAVQFKLKQRFPELKIAPRGHTGASGPALVAALVAVWLLILIFMPNKPLWFMYLMSMINI